MSYVDGFIVPVPTANKEAYRKVAETASAVFTDHGALRVVECWSDDLPKGKQTDFWMSVKSKPEEAVVFSWIEWPSKAARDAGMKKSMNDPRMQPNPQNMPFDGMRMIFGGFETLVDAKGKS